MNIDDTTGTHSGEFGAAPTASEQEALDALHRSLGDQSLWVQPPAALQEQIVAAIAEARGDQRRRRPRFYALVGVAAAVLIAAGIGLGVRAWAPGNEVQYSATLAGSQLAPKASGDVILTKTTSGWEIYLHAKGLPRRADGIYYEAWLKSADGVLVPVGTFNSFEDVTLWSGVPPTSHPIFTVTRQVANGDPASTGQVVLSGITKLKD